MTPDWLEKSIQQATKVRIIEPQVLPPSASRRAMQRQLRDLAIHAYNLERERDDLLAALIKVLSGYTPPDITTPEGRARTAEIHDVIRSAIDDVRRARDERDKARAMTNLQILEDLHPLRDTDSEQG